MVVKNRLGPPNRKVRYSVFYDSGIDDIFGTLKLLKEYGVVKQGGAWYKYTTADGEKHQFLAKEFADLLESHPTAKEELYEALCDKYIMKYRHEKEDNLDRDPDETIIENE